MHTHKSSAALRSLASELGVGLRERAAIPIPRFANVHLYEDANTRPPGVLLDPAWVIKCDRGTFHDHGCWLTDELEAGFGDPFSRLRTQFLDDLVESSLVRLEIQSGVHGQVADPGAVGLSHGRRVSRPAGHVRRNQRTGLSAHPSAQ